MPSWRGVVLRADLMYRVLTRPGQLVEFPRTRTDLFDFLRPIVPQLPDIPPDLRDMHQPDAPGATVVESSEPDVARTLFTIASLQQARRVVEVGVFRGYTSRFLAAAVAPRGGELHLVDLSQEALDIACRSAGAVTGARVAPHRGFSNAPEVLAAVPGDCDLIYLDADHSEAGVDAELAVWVPKLRPGGVVAVHDTVHYTGVCRAANRAADRHPSVTLATSRGCGLTLIRRED